MWRLQCRFVEVRRIIQNRMLSHHPDGDVACGCPPVPTHSCNLKRATRALLHRIRTDSAFTRNSRHRIRLSDNSACPSCCFDEDLTRALWECGAHITQREEICRTLRAANCQCQCLKKRHFSDMLNAWRECSICHLATLPCADWITGKTVMCTAPSSTYPPFQCFIIISFPFSIIH